MPVGRSTVERERPIRTGEGARGLAQVGGFLGRAEELAELAEALGEARLLTLTGPPGIGKTQLARELLSARSESCPDGGRLVELAPVTDSALLPEVLATALGVQEVPGQPLTEVLVAHLRGRRMLLAIEIASTCSERGKTVE